jgi:hypothetical protein
MKPMEQDPAKMIEAIEYLKGLEDKQGGTKWMGYYAPGKFGYVEAFIRREIQMLRNNKSKKEKVGMSKKGKLTVKSE